MMAAKTLDLGGVEGYLAFRFGWVHCLPNARTGRLPQPLHCVPWQVRSGPAGSWVGEARRFIAELERGQEAGDLENVSRNLPALDQVADRLDHRAEQLADLATRARAIVDRHEPSAGNREL